LICTGVILKPNSPQNVIFLVFGEAVARIDKPFKDKYPCVDWRDVNDFRNNIVQDYVGIDDATCVGCNTGKSGSARKRDGCCPGICFMNSSRFKAIIYDQYIKYRDERTEEVRCGYIYAEAEDENRRWPGRHELYQIEEIIRTKKGKTRPIIPGTCRHRLKIFASLGPILYRVFFIFLAC